MARRMHPMESGERTHYVELRPQTQSTGTSGFPVETSGTALPAWASRQDVGGRERFAADQLSAPYTTRWEVAYRSEIDPDQVDVPKGFTLVYQGRTFDITTASMIGAREGVELLTRARMG